MSITQKLKQQEYLFFIISFLALSIVWSYLTNYTWDDDAVTRFFNTRDAGKTVYNFIDSWDRPLFVTLFYLPVHFFGKTGVAVLMSLLTACSGLFIYKGLKYKGIENASAAVVFMVFQTFLFGITRDAMTEPLASFFISWGIYLYYTKQYAWFAVIGSLLPLARTETVLLVPFWLFVLIEQKKYKLIPLLGVGLFCWFLAWFAWTGNLHAFFGEVLKTGETANRYGHTKITHQFSKYVYVLGPVAFFFCLLGYLTSIKKLFTDYFIMLQFTAGFVMYVLFSSVLDIGQSGGALRNLVTIAPFAAIIALYGFNYWMGIFEKKQAEPAITPVSLKKKAEKNATTKSGSSQTVGFRKMIIFIFILFLMMLSASLLTDKLMYRQFFSEDEKDYTIILFLAGCSALVIISFLGIFKKMPGLIMCALFALQISFTLYYENPDSHGNDERAAINDMANWITHSKMGQKKIYCNHPWYYWASGGTATDSVHYGRIDSALLKNVPQKSIVIWEGHYTNKNYSNTPIDIITRDTTMNVVYYGTNSQLQPMCIAFAKINSVQEGTSLYNDLAKQWPNNSRVFYLKGFYERRIHDLPAAIASFSQALKIDPSNAIAWYDRGVAYLMMNDKNKGCEDLRQANSLGNLDANKLLPSACK